jgi:hypothetical protein
VLAPGGTSGEQAHEYVEPNMSQNDARAFLRMRLRSRPIRTAAQEVSHLHQLERVGESEWTPWIAITGLILFLAAIGLLMFGIVEAASHLLASAFPDARYVP